MHSLLWHKMQARVNLMLWLLYLKCMKRKLGRPQVRLDLVTVRKHPEPARYQTSVIGPITCHFTELTQLHCKYGSIYLCIGPDHLRNTEKLYI